MALLASTRIGHFEIISSIGAGGMGEVYRARDTKLARDVAIKVLPELLARDPERISRLKREAQVLASLNHSNIAQIFGVEDAGDRYALVMELVDGPTLADRLSRGALPLDEAWPIARQIAEAVAAAHEDGIIHRDLKPANIKIRSDGTVKVLDFGLAKALSTSTASDASGVETTAPAMTGAGVVVGTAAYMSPEQARGDAVGRRTDLWSFGVVFYEMLSGARPFAGLTSSDTIASVLAKEPDWTQLPPNTPGSIRRLLRHCLAKDSRHRLDSAAAARLEIEDVVSDGPDQQSRRAPKLRLGSLTAVIGLLAAAAFVAGVWMWRSRDQGVGTQAGLTHFSIVPPLDLPLTPQGVDNDFALAPDGSFLVYRTTAEAQLAVRWFARAETVPVAGVSDARGPFVSPNGRWIGFIENNTTLKRIPVTGGSPITLARLPGSPRGAVWVDDATIVVATNASGLLRIPASGGDPVELTAVDRAQGETGHSFPAALPGGSTVLFTIRSSEPSASQVAVLDLKTRQRTTLLRGASDARYVRPGYLMYADGMGLSAIRFDATARAVTGEPTRLVEDVSVSPNGALHAAVTESGTLVYVTAAPNLAPLRSLVWVDRRGRETAIELPPRGYVSARLSPDGERAALEIRERGPAIWLLDLTRKTLSLLTFNGGMAPVWAPDGARIVYASPGQAGPPNVFARASDGSGSELRLSTSANIQIPTAVVRDSSFIVGAERRPTSGSDIVRLAIGKADAAEALVATDATEQNGEISPDGRFLAYESNASGNFEIYVRPYPKTSNGEWKVSTEGGTRPLWTRDGRELIYLDAGNRPTLVRVDTISVTFRSSTPTLVSKTPYSTSVAWRTYDVSPDGARLLMVKDEPLPRGVAPPTFTVVLNWVSELKTKLPP